MLQKDFFMSDSHIPTPEEQIFALLGAQNQITIATAESITAGSVAARLARPAGASAYLQGGVVSYAYEVKERILGVPRSVLENPGAVSDECARLMATGVANALGATIAVSTTGIAGPAGATSRKSVGLVYIAVSGPGGIISEENIFPGNREEITHASTERALTMLLTYLQDHLPSVSEIEG